MTVAAVDFKGNVLESARRVIADAPILHTYQQAASNGWQVVPFQVQWTPGSGQSRAAREAELLEADGYVTTTSYDALNRVVRHVLPADVEGHRREFRPTYNRAGALDQLQLDDVVYVQRITYDAKGQRTLVAYGNGVMTRYGYDPRTFRLLRLRSERYTLVDGLTYRPAGDVLQDYGYDYDLTGNILAVRDRTPGSGIPANPQALGADDPRLRALLGSGDALDRRYTYDPLYRLLTATGREYQAPPPGDPWTDMPRGTDVTRTQPYTQTYGYDAVGNILTLGHRSTGGFTRAFTVAADSNRLQQLTVGNTPYDYGFDANGNLTAETTSRHFAWNYADRLTAFATQTAGAEPSVHAQYLYDAAGQRVKKLVRRQGGAVEVTHYLDQVFEHHRWSSAAADSPAGENNHVHVMDDRQRIALARFGPAHPDDRGPVTAFHLGDHLGSSVTVVDEGGTFVSREEYIPYGETSFGSYARKRYRFTGQERDEESGLSYHSARYYAPALARWTSCDPRPHGDGTPLYQYCACDPLNKVDPAGTEWCWNPFASDCGVDWETVGQVASTAEVLLACGATPVTDGLTAALCLDGVDNWTSSTMHQPSAKQVIISSALQVAGMPEEQADQAASIQAAIISGLLGGMAAAQASRPARTVAATTTAGTGTTAAAAGGAAGRTMSRELITGGKVRQLDTNMVKALSDSSDALHAEASAFAAANKGKTLVASRAAVREMGAKIDNRLIKAELGRLGLQADLSQSIENLEPLAERYMNAFRDTGRVLNYPDALNLASAQLAKRTLVTADIRFYKRALDLGVTDIEFVGTADNVALAAKYKPQRVTVP